MVPEIVRIGVANSRIKCVTPQRVEYLDEAGQECFVDLDKCVRITGLYDSRNQCDRRHSFSCWNCEPSSVRPMCASSPPRTEIFMRPCEPVSFDRISSIDSMPFLLKCLLFGNEETTFLAGESLYRTLCNQIRKGHPEPSRSVGWIYFDLSRLAGGVNHNDNNMRLLR
jgi:hypothetical protein